MSVPVAESLSEKSESGKLNELVEGIAEKRDAREVSLEKILIDLEANCSLPEGVVEMISKRIEEHRKNGIDEENLRKVARHFIMDTLPNYYDERIGIANFNFLKAELMELVDGVLEEGTEHLNEVAMIFFDVDGLKSVNDNALKKHAAGDLFLEKIADVLADGRTAQWLRNAGMKFYPTRRSGDEFMCAVKANIPLDEKSDFVGIDGNPIENGKLIEYIIQKIQEDIRALNMDDVQNFSDEKQKEAYRKLGFDVDSWPSDFRFMANISGGAASLKGAMLDLQSKGSEEKKYEESLLDIVNGMIEISDNKMMENKKIDKKKRTESNDPNERLLETVYRSGRSDKERIKELEYENNALKERMAQLEEMLKRAQGQKEAE